MARLVPLLVLLTLLAGCDLCWVRGQSMGPCPADDDDAADDDDSVEDDDDAVDDDDSAPDDDDSASDDDDAVDDDDSTPGDPCEGVPTTLAVRGVQIDLVCVEPGSFYMGSPTSEDDRDGDEEQHQVHLTRAFLITATEITQAAYAELTGLNPSDCLYGCGDEIPVHDVTWSEALGFGNELSGRFGLPDACDVQPDDVDTTCDFDARGWRLPTESEWEYAARGGEQHRFSGSNVLEDVGWCTGAAQPYEAREVGQLDPNAWGLFDMTGNVAEWTWDRYGDYPGEVTDPTGPDFGSFLTHRGGAFPQTEGLCRVADRSAGFGSDPNWNRGFRVVRTITGDDVVTADAQGMVPVHGGPFVLGCDGDCLSDEGPERTITVDPFRIDVYEVTVAEFVDFLNDHGNDCGESDCLGAFSEPEIEQDDGTFTTSAPYAGRALAEATWYGADAYCAWKGKRLPTEAEWERAARGPAGGTYAWGEDDPDCSHAIASGCGPGDPMAPGSAPLGQAACGAWDLTGNVWEWTSDWYDADYHENVSDTNPTGPTWGTYKTVRGGGWESNTSTLAAWARWGRLANSGGASTGFRCAADPAG